MKITLIPSAFAASGSVPEQYLTSYVINDRIAIDAGSLGFSGRPEEQAQISHVFLSHSHMDHVASLPIFLENVAGLAPDPVVVHASAPVQECLRADLFAGRLWANFLELTHEKGRFATVNTLHSGVPVEVEGLRVTPISVHHVVPTLGFIIEEPGAAVVISSDTGPTEEIWHRALLTSNLKAVFLEATFPNDHQRLADLTMHLTPADFLREMQKLPTPAPFFAVHLKARFRAEVAEELLAAQCPNLRIAQPGTTYEF